MLERLAIGTLWYPVLLKMHSRPALLEYPRQCLDNADFISLRRVWSLCDHAVNAADDNWAR